MGNEECKRNIKKKNVKKLNGFFSLNLNFYYFILRLKKRYREICKIDNTSYYKSYFRICLIHE